MPVKTDSERAFEILAQWKYFIGDHVEDRQRIGEVICNVLDEAVECLRQSYDWKSAEQCADWGLTICQYAPEDEVVVVGLTGRMCDVNFPKATVEFHRGVFLFGQSRRDSAAEFFRMSMRDFSYSPTGSIRNSSSVGACLAEWAVGVVASAQQDWGKALQAFQHSLHLIDQRDSRAEDLRQLLNNEIHAARAALHQHFQTNASSAGRSTHQVTTRVGKLRTIPILAKIAAGTPLPTREGEPLENVDPDNLISQLVLDEEHTRGASFGLLVKGDSMSEAGIWDGDYALLRRQEEANNGDIVAVQIVRMGEDDIATLKKYYREKDHWRLEPMNNKYNPIVVLAKHSRERIEQEYARRNVSIDVRVDANVYVVGRVVAVWRRI
jgi:SOS-response transcriptional repressor LexA